MIKRWNPAGVAAPIGRYSHLASVPFDHDSVLIAGQVGVLADGTLAGPGAHAQATQVFANIEGLLDSLGVGPRNLVRLFVMVSGTEYLDDYRAVSREVFAKWYPDGDWPAQSLIVVAALARPELTVEIEGTVAVPHAG